jgi:hypothetical protein
MDIFGDVKDNNNSMERRMLSRKERAGGGKRIDVT